MPNDKEKRDRIKAAFPLVNRLDGDESMLAAYSGVTIEDVERIGKDADFVAELETEISNAETAGRLAAPIAHLLLLKGLDRIRKQIDTLDAFEAAEVMKPLQRIVDAADRRQALSKNKYADLPMVNIVIGSNMSVTATPVVSDFPGAATATAAQDVEIKPSACVTPVPQIQTLTFEAFDMLATARNITNGQGGD
jgi:hypothetical protein